MDVQEVQQGQQYRIFLDMTFNNEIWSAITTMEFDFEGKSAHAAAMPWDGRSALDAAELMNVGVQFLREHVIQDVRIHYVYRNGGLAPNIVPDKASLYYFIRSREENMKEAVTAIMGTDIGLKAAMFAGEAMAQTALAVAGDPELLKKAWDEFHENYKEPYKCIIPKED